MSTISRLAVRKADELELRRLQLPLKLFKATVVLLQPGFFTDPLATPTPSSPQQRLSLRTTHLRAPSAYQASRHGAVTSSYSGSSFQLSGGSVLFSQTFMRTMTKTTQTQASYIDFKAGVIFLNTPLHSAAPAECGR